MRLIQPDFYDQFQCTASACSDTCCAGWGIVVDRETVAQYRQATGAIFGEVRQKLVEDGDDVLFAMEPDGRCPFLNQDNLCRLILAEGEDCLCQICTDHPRFFAWYGDFAESGIGLCCEEGARLLLELDRPLTLVERETEEEGDWDFAADILFGLRQVLLEIIFDDPLTPAEKWAEMVAITTETQLDLAPDVAMGTENPLESWENLLKTMGDMVPIDEKWPLYLQELRGNLEKLAEKQGEFAQSKAFSSLEQANIFAYLLYRHLPNAMWDGRLVGRLWMVRWSFSFVHLAYLHHWATHGNLPLSAKINLLKNWSKQVEYCDDNVEMLLKL